MGRNAIQGDYLMKKTMYPGYYITDEGVAYREPVQHERRSIEPNGLVRVSTHLRGHPDYPEHRYESINVSLRTDDMEYIRDDNGKVMQKKAYIHHLVAEAYLPPKEPGQEIDHKDRNKKNNKASNLRYLTHYDNVSPCARKSYTITDTVTGQKWSGDNLRDWVKDNYDLIETRQRVKGMSVKDIAKGFYWGRTRGTPHLKFKVEW